MISRENKLAIVIPAFKSSYLNSALQSIITQTNQNFNLYICIDGILPEVAAIADLYKSYSNTKVIQFETNKGKNDLVGQWARCIDQTQDEDFIWLFPDDDVMGGNCVESFYKLIESESIASELYRFDNCFIDENEEFVSQFQHLPAKESNIDFILKRLSLQRLSSVTEYIFSRKAYTQNNGFCNFPAGWFADDATWMIFSSKTGIQTIPNAIVYIRQSPHNISNSKDKFQSEKLKATYLYINNILKSFEAQKKEIHPLLPRFLFSQYLTIGKQFSFFELIQYGIKNSQILDSGVLKNIYRLIKYNSRQKHV